jgi:hypothetical protein
MLEPDVTLTDAGLALECAAFAVLLARGRAAPARGVFAAFFAVLAASAALGAAEHGFVADKHSLAEAVVWSATLLAVGLAAVTGAVAGARLVLAPRASRAVTVAATVALAGYALAIVAGERRFSVAVAFYLPAATFLLAAFGIAARRARSRALAAGAWGMALTFVASALQQGRVALHPRYLDHNALYHLVEAVALWLVFRGARAVVDSPSHAGAAVGGRA